MWPATSMPTSSSRVAEPTGNPILAVMRSRSLGSIPSYRGVLDADVVLKYIDTNQQEFEGL